MKGRRLTINKIKTNLTKGILIFIFISWFLMVYLFSSQTGRESSRVSTKVTRELLKTKDTLTAVMEHYKDTNKIVIKRT